jgi:hypothetical protein
VAKAVASIIATLALLFTGVAFAAPVNVLRIASDRGRTIDLEATRFRYEYTHSIYQVPASEEFVVEGRELRLVLLRSPDRRVFEYQRWPGQPRDAGDTLIQEPPPTVLQHLRLRVISGAAQRILAAGRTIDLEATFGEGQLSVQASVSNRAQWLAGLVLER